MPCPSLRLVMSQAWPSPLLRDSKVAGHSSPLSAGALPETYGRPRVPRPPEAHATVDAATPPQP